MNWFRRHDEVAESESQPQKDAQSGDGADSKDEEVRTAAERLAELDDNINEREAELSAKTLNLETLTKKLSSVKEEYGIMVDNLMNAKKEHIGIRKETESLANEKIRLASEMEEKRAELVSLSAQYSEKKEELETVRNDQRAAMGARISTEKAKAEYKRTHAELERIRTMLEKTRDEQTRASRELEKKREEIKIAEGELRRIQAQRDVAGGIRPKGADSGKNVVEAAGAVVASMNQKIRSIEEELKKTKTLLAKERAGRAGTGS